MPGRPDLTDFLTPRRSAGWGTLALVVLWHAAVLYVLWFRPGELVDGLQRLEVRTSGFVNTGWVVALLLLAGLALIAGGLGRLRPADLGLEHGRLLAGAWRVVLLWVAIQAAQAGVAFGRGEDLALAGGWTQAPARTAGALAGQLFGTALFEEAVYRHLLVAQLFALLTCIGNRGGRLTCAVFLTQLVFAGAHFGLHSQGDPPPADLALRLLVAGLLGGLYFWVYARTRNLWFVIGLHALCNAPSPLVRPVFDTTFVLQQTTLAVLIADHLSRALIRSSRAPRT